MGVQIKKIGILPSTLLEESKDKEEKSQHTHHATPIEPFIQRERKIQV
ncbi:hypothetical protein GFS33_10570 [Sulfolobus sp. E11-6]|nr:hypothetical protein GFS33_10570 [Sulfolobus sp. E11-6]